VLGECVKCDFGVGCFFEVKLFFSRMVLLGISVLSFNAPQARRGFVCGAVLASFAAGTLLWTLIEWAVFLKHPDFYPFYVLCLSLSVPLFYFLSAFLLFKVCSKKMRNCLWSHFARNNHQGRKAPSGAGSSSVSSSSLFCGSCRRHFHRRRARVSQ
jgi:hypothetical protein